MRQISTICLLAALAVLVPLQVLAQTARADLTLIDGRTVQLNRPVLMEQTNPGWTPALYRSTGEVAFSGTETIALRWSDVSRIDYYPVDRGTNCASVVSLRDGTMLGIKYQLVFDLADEGIINQLPSGVISFLRSARWHSEFKSLTAPHGLHHLGPYGGANNPSVWDLLQCAYFVDNDRAHDRPKIKSIVFK